MAHEPEYYDILIKGHLDDSWVVWFEGMTLCNRFDQAGQPIACISGAIRDQAALYGMLCRLRDLGLALISVVRQTDA
jgi:hypothetical protein